MVVVLRLALRPVNAVQLALENILQQNGGGLNRKTSCSPQRRRRNSASKRVAATLPILKTRQPHDSRASVDVFVVRFSGHMRFSPVKAVRRPVTYTLLVTDTYLSAASIAGFPRSLTLKVPSLALLSA